MKRFWLDLLFTLFLPMVIWNVGKDALGDYYAIILLVLRISSGIYFAITGVLIALLMRKVKQFRVEKTAPLH